MSRYRVYKSPTGDTVRVKTGFSWQACFLGSISALLRRAWLMIAAGLTFFLAEFYFVGGPAPTSRMAALGLALLGVYAVYMVFCGINGNRWLCDSLRRRSYTLIGEERRPMWAGWFGRGAAGPRRSVGRRLGPRPAVSRSAPLRAFASTEATVQEPAALPG